MLKSKLDTDYLLKWLNKTDSGFKSRSKPLVILSYATSLDGSITQIRGESTPISCDESTEAVHHIRAFCDAIMVGIGTVISDNPRLSVRLVSGDNPIPIIIDTNLRTPLDSQLARENSNTIIFSGHSPDKHKKEQLESKGVLVIESPKTERGLSFSQILNELYARGIRSLMVEGGAEIFRSFFLEELWDKIAVTVAPVFLGGYNLIEADTLISTQRFKSVKWMSAGTDQICLIDKDTV